MLFYLGKALASGVFRHKLLVTVAMDGAGGNCLNNVTRLIQEHLLVPVKSLPDFNSL